MKVFPIPLFEDNYSYFVLNKNNNQAFLVDPAKSNVIFDYILKEHPKVNISHILLTHKHYDHAGDTNVLLQLLKKYYSSQDKIQNIEVLTGKEDAFDYTTIKISEKKEFIIDNMPKITALPAPCHTRGHTLFFLEEEGISNPEKSIYDKVLFTGDTLFVGGCGKFFEGNGEEMLKNFDIIEKLPEETYIFCGHEYSVKTLSWCYTIEWENKDLEKKLEWAKERRKINLPTVPSTIADEKKTNTFMRTRKEIIQKKLGIIDPVKVMTRLREMRDNNIPLSKIQEKF